MITLSASSAQAQYSGRIIDMRSALSQDIMSLLEEQGLGFSLAQIQAITREVQLAAFDYSVEPGLLLALMAGEQQYAGYPQARLYYYNLDHGSFADEDDFPSAWFDAERVARSYYVQFDRYGNKASSIAAYFVGSRALPPDGDISGQNQGLIDLVSTIMTNSAQWSHLGEISGPQVVETRVETPVTSYEPVVQYDLTEIEQAYVDNMMYFNPRLTDEIAGEIFDAIHQHASSYQRVDARLVMALVACESSFRPDAVSRAGAQGLGQLMPFTSQRFGVSDPFDVNENIRATFAYLDREIERWSGKNYPLDRILAAYNAGPGAVEEYTNAPYHGIPPYEETVNYVRKVVNIYFYLLPEGERAERLSGQSRHVISQANGTVQLAS